METAIISGKGGTGKSSISAAFASLAKNVVLADCDVDAANLYLIFDPVRTEEQKYVGGKHARIDNDRCTLCGLCREYCRFGAVSNSFGNYVIDEIMCDGCQLCFRICPAETISMVVNDKSRMYAGAFRYGHMVYGRLAPGEENSGKLVNLVRKKTRDLMHLNGYKHIIIDGPPGIGCPVISSISGVDRVVIVTEPSVSAMHDMVRALDMVNRFNIKAFVVINKYDLNTDLTMEIERHCLVNNIPIAGKIPFDPLVTEAMVKQKTITEWAPEAPISRNIERIWGAIIFHHDDNI